MPDAYGNPTPQEVIAAMQQNARKQFMLAQQSGSAGVRAGASLGALFGGTIKKTIDTRAARAEEATRLMKTKGYSKEQAWDEAKSTIGREHAEVRKARRLQDATSDVQEFIQSMPAEIPEDMKRAQGMIILASRLRSMGMTTEANNLTTQASEAMQAARDRQLNIENLKARTRASNASAASSEAAVEDRYVTPFMENVLKKEQILAELQDPNSQMTSAEREAKMRMKGHLEARILKEQSIVGRTEYDTKDPVLMRKMFADLADNNVLVANIDEAINQFNDLDNFERTFWAGLGKDTLGFMEQAFGRKPTETEREFMSRVQTKEGKSALIAAKVRHALTGAQMSAFEIQYLTPFLPSPDDPVSVALDKLNIVKAYTQLDSDVRLQMFMSGSLDNWANAVRQGAAPSNAPPAAATPDDTANMTPEDRIAAEIARRQQNAGTN